MMTNATGWGIALILTRSWTRIHTNGSLWGTATSAYQIEGAYKADGRGFVV
ncbi:MAG TPA: family 1 glycosylhydrolase [Candidatus Binatia bacterium]|jgi:Glycosyl hydrolase family 1